jgi:2-polyprenyl-3-methyl-5-hydroxy-6-metoxy-1,4-benzoquinol methylase
LDDVARYNVDRWVALAEADAPFTRPWLGLDEATARRRLDPEGRLDDMRGKDMLCLAGGGGQQAPAFALLGARVTSLDLSREQVGGCPARRGFSAAVPV